MPFQYAEAQLIAAGCQIPRLSRNLPEIGGTLPAKLTEMQRILSWRMCYSQVHQHGLTTHKKPRQC
jgi:hypothetical protein